jgi:hypothetical protein
MGAKPSILPNPEPAAMPASFIVCTVMWFIHGVSRFEHDVDLPPQQHGAAREAQLRLYSWTPATRLTTHAYNLRTMLLNHIFTYSHFHIFHMGLLLLSLFLTSS